MRFFPESFRISTPGDREIEIVRELNAPRELVFDAFTKPELVRRWLLGPDGWSMPVCDIDLKAGGKYRYVWLKESTGEQMGMGGVFREVKRPEKVVATETFDDAWYPGEALNTTVFTQHGDVTTVKLTVQYESKAARDTASRSGMDSGMIAGYNRLEEVLSSVGGGLTLIETPEVTEAAPRLTAAIHLTIPRSRIQSEMQPGLNEIMSVIKEQGIGPAGRWFTHHFRMDPAIFDFEICVPVSSPVKNVGRVVSREMPTMKVVQTVYSGGYEKLGSAWGEFNNWIGANGHKPGPDHYESYVIGPESSPNSTEWRTELQRPLVI